MHWVRLAYAVADGLQTQMDENPSRPRSPEHKTECARLRTLRGNAVVGAVISIETMIRLAGRGNGTPAEGTPPAGCLGPVHIPATTLWLDCAGFTKPPRGHIRGRYGSWQRYIA